MRVTRIMAIVSIVVLLVLATCADPATTLVPAPVASTPSTEPPLPELVATPVSEPTTPAPVPTIPTTTVPASMVPNSTAPESKVLISDSEFSPHTLTVTIGTTVFWVNVSSKVQTVYSPGELFDESAMGPGGSVSYTFTKSGTYKYYSQYDPEMQGVVIVE